MNITILQDHYNRKYVSESSASQIKLIKQVKIPTTRYEAVVKFLPLYFKGGDIIELGAGNGNVAKTLLNLPHMNITHYTLADISQPRLEGLLKNMEDSRVSILLMDAEDIPQSEFGKYDAVIMIALIEHLIDPLRAMQRIRQLLKPGGFVYIDTPNFARYTLRLKLLMGYFPSTASTNEGLTKYSGEECDLYDEGHMHYFTYLSLSLMLTERCDFSKVIMLPYPVGRIPLGKHIHNYLAKIWPGLFSELALIAYT